MDHFLVAVDMDSLSLDAVKYCQVSWYFCWLQAVILVDAVSMIGVVACCLAGVTGVCIFLAVFNNYLTQICKVRLQILQTRMVYPFI